MKTPEYITIKEASERSGKHMDTIRAFIKSHGVKTIKNPQGRVLIPVEALEGVYELKHEGSKTESATEQAQKVEVKDTREDLVEFLKAELEEKNKLIQKQMETIDDMQKTLTNLVNQQQQLSNGVLMLSAKNQEEEQAEPQKKKKFRFFGKK